MMRNAIGWMIFLIILPFLASLSFPLLSEEEQMRGTATIHGYVTEQSVSPCPVAGAAITVYNGFYDYSVLTNSVGWYEIENIEAGTYTVCCSAEGYHPDTAFNVDIADGQYLEIDFSLGKIIPPPPFVIAEYADPQHTSVLISWDEPVQGDFAFFRVFRLVEGQENDPGSWELLADQMITTCYNDTGWQSLDTSRYLYAVRSATGMHSSDPAFSNKIERGLSVKIQLMNVYGIQVESEILLQNQDELPEHQYERTICTPVVSTTFFDVWPGTYDLYIYASGYSPYGLNNFNLHSNITLTISMPFSFPCPMGIWVNFTTMEVCWLPPAIGTRIIYTQDFESGEIPYGWTQEYIDSTISWTVRTGGEYGVPENAHGGAFNASFAGSSGTTMLVTPSLMLKNTIVPQMKFWYSDPSDSLSSDRFKIYFRTDDTDEWRLWSDLFPTSGWKDYEYPLSNPSERFYIGFSGTTQLSGGMGICLDDIQITDALIDSSFNGMLGYEVYLDGHYLGGTGNNRCLPLGDILPGFHIVFVSAIYPGGQSIFIELPFYNYPCTDFNTPKDFSVFVNNFVATLNWNPPDSVTGHELVGYKIYRDGESIDYLDDTVLQYIDPFIPLCYSDQVLKKEYNVTAVYKDGESCLLDPPFMMYSFWPFPLPENLQAEKVGGDTVMVTWSPPEINPPDSSGLPYGYHVYKNHVVIGFTADTSYTDILKAPGVWDYEITALYEGDIESCFTDPVSIRHKANGIHGLVYDAISMDILTGVTIHVCPDGPVVSNDADGYYDILDLLTGPNAFEALCPGYNSRYFSETIDNYGFLRRDIFLTDSSVRPIPFSESWDSLSFELQDWSFEPNQELWHIDADSGNPAPCAAFGSVHSLDGYHCALVSDYIDAISAEENLYFSFDLKQGCINPTGNEKLMVEIWDGRFWWKLAEFENIQNTDWEHYLFDVGYHLMGEVARVRFTAFGEHSTDLGFWEIDNIRLEDRRGITLSGAVMNACGNPLPGSVVHIDDDSLTTGPSGNFSLEVFAGLHTIKVTEEGYNPYSMPFTLDYDQFIEIRLNNPLIDPDPKEIYVESWGGIETQPLQLTNAGTGPATWQANIIYPGQLWDEPPRQTFNREENPNVPAQADRSRRYTQFTATAPRETWDLLFSIELADGADNCGSGAVYANDRFYAGKWNSNILSVYTRNGEFISNEVINDLENLRDLTWDGSFLYGGSAAPVIYQIDIQDYIITDTIQTPVFVRGITYDPHNDAFWVCDWETDLYLVGREGQTLAVIPNPGVAGVYGLAYDNLTGPASLWLFCQGEPGATFVQLDIATGQLTGQIHDVLAELNPPGFPVAGGAFLSTEIVPGVVTLGGIVQADNNILFGYELKSSSWLSLSSYTGQLDAGCSQVLNVHFDGEGLNWGELYEATIHFASDPHVPVPEVQVGYRLVTGLGDPAAGTTIAIYPNPANRSLIIECPEKIQRIDLCDNQGRLVKSILLNQSGLMFVDTQGLPLGLYYFKVHLDFGRIVVKKTIIR